MTKNDELAMAEILLNDPTADIQVSLQEAANTMKKWAAFVDVIADAEGQEWMKELKDDLFITACMVTAMRNDLAIHNVMDRYSKAR